MGITFNHAFFAHLFGLPEPTTWGPFASVALSEGVHSQFAETGRDIQPQHDAFLVDDATFDAIYGRMLGGDLAHCQGGACTFSILEIITRPYGSA